MSYDDFNHIKIIFHNHLHAYFIQFSTIINILLNAQKYKTISHAYFLTNYLYIK